MSIPEEKIMQHLDMLLSSSEPGAILHHLHVIAAPLSAIGPLGLPDPEKLEASVYAIAPVGIEPVGFILKAIRAAHADHLQRGYRILFAALSDETWSVMDPEDKELAIRLHKVGKLREHPEAVELTQVYGACSDGRRWRGRRFLTGPKAGQSEDVELLVGRPAAGEAFGAPWGTMLRKIVGMDR